MVKFEEYKHVILGIGGGFIAGISPYLDFLTKLGQFLGVFLGVITAGTALYLKILEIKEKKSKKKNGK